MQLDYVMQTRDAMVADAKRDTAAVSRRSPFHKKVENARIVVSVPKGGGEIRGILQSLDTSGANPEAERAINESGVSVKPPSPSKPKDGIKH